MTGIEQEKTMLLRSLFAFVLISATVPLLPLVNMETMASAFSGTLQTGGVNVALAANGATAMASSTVNSNYPVSAVNDGDRKGLNWGAGGGWNDGTLGQFPDWVELDFGVSQAISEIDVFTCQDAELWRPVEPPRR